MMSYATRFKLTHIGQLTKAPNTMYTPSLLRSAGWAGFSFCSSSVSAWSLGMRKDNRDEKTRGDPWFGAEIERILMEALHEKN